MKEFPLYRVEIDAGKFVLNRAVPASEIPVLRAVWGATDGTENYGRVREQGLSMVPGSDGKDEPDTIELEDSAAAEFDRLQRTYRRLNAPDLVKVAYPLGPSQLEAYGFTVGPGQVKPAESSQVIRHPKVKPGKK